MGITGLIPFLEKASRRTNINEFAGKTVAIDSYCWLHKGVFSCAEKLMLGEHTNLHVNYCMKYINMLLSHKIKPILVFDGRHLPAKAQTEAKRRENRKANREKAVQLMKMGRHAEANNLLKRALDISHEMALEVIKQCQKMNVDCIVAPYEADSQLAYLNINGIADVIITEDSDLLLFGSKKVFFKMDLYGHGLLIDNEQLYRAMDTSPENFCMDKFIHMCILSGCDYLPSLPGIGLGKARKFITLNTNCDIYQALTRLGAYLKMKSLVVTQEYRDAFILAIITFKHQLVYCPLRRKQVRLNPPPPDVTDEQLRYAGEETDPETALQLALGNYDPFTLKKLHDFDPDKVENQITGKTSSRHASIWSRKYKLRSSFKESSEKENSILKSDVVNKNRSLTKENLTPEKSDVVNKRRSRLTNCTPVAQEDNLCEKLLNQQEILNLYESGGVDNNNSNANETRCNESGTSPDLIKRNPFLKQSHVNSPNAESPDERLTSPILTRDKAVRQLPDDNNETSPSFLSTDVNRIKSRYLRRRIRRRIVMPEGVTTESKFFVKPTPETNVEERTDMNELETENMQLEVNRKINDIHLESVEGLNEKADLCADNDRHGTSRVLTELNNESPKRDAVQAHLNITINELPARDDTDGLKESRLNTSLKENDNANELEESRLDVSVNEPTKENDISKLYDLNGPLMPRFEFDVDPDFLVSQEAIDNVNCSFGWPDKKIGRGSPNNKIKKNKSYSNSRTSIYGKAKDGTRRKQMGLEKSQTSLLNFFEAKQKA